MNLRKLTDQELETRIHCLIQDERKILHLVVLHIHEVSRRKLFLVKGFSSLFDYLTNEMKYSNAAAQRRIEAARLLNDVPSLSDKLESGAIHLNQIGEIQKSIKSAESVHAEKVPKSMKQNLVERVLGLNHSSTQQVCAEALNIPVVQPQKITTQKDNSKRVEVTFTKEQYAKFEQLRDLLAHKNFQNRRTQNMNDVLETIFDEVLSQKKPNNEADVKPSKQRLTKATSAAEVKINKVSSNEKTIWKSLTPKRKQTILNQDRCCQYENPDTGEVCGSTFNLHVDHIRPKHFGGSNHPNNLRVLCREHNLFRNSQTEGFRSHVSLDRDRGTHELI